MKLLRLFDEKETKLLQELSVKLQWVDGTASARGKAVEKKKNLQSHPGSKDFDPIETLVSNAIKTKLEYLVFPKKIVGLRASLYRENHGEYGWHVDMPTMQGERADISFTIFVSDNNAYEGGELEIEQDSTQYKVKGTSGEIVLYASGDRHRVLPVTKGDRLVIVGWISSFIPNENDRLSITSLQQAVALIDAVEQRLTEPDPSLATLEKARELVNDNLHRLIRTLSK